MNLSESYDQKVFREDEKPLDGFDEFMQMLSGKFYAFYPHRMFLLKEANQIAKLSLTYELLNEEQFSQKVQEYRSKFKLGVVPKNRKLLHQALALICEASFRTLGIRPYSVQILGALAMYENFVVEMHTGEGKTITAGLVAVLYSWAGKPCHVVTSNDYLAQRDAEELREFYEFCGLSVGFVGGDMQRDERRDNYKKSIIYATSNEILADFLRDQMESSYATSFNSLLLQGVKREHRDDSVIQGLHNIIIDEADSLLADEAIIPLIISVPKENKPLIDAILSTRKVSTLLEEKKHYTLSNKHKEVFFTEEGEEFIEGIVDALTPLWKSKNRREYLLKQAIIAKNFYLNGTHYVISEGKLVIVDEKTGRLMPNRSWGNGLHQAVEAKEGIELSDPTETHIQMSFQRFFRLYKNVCGMSGTLQKLESELWHIYNLATLKIPKRIPNKYKVLKEQILETKEKKWQVVVEEIANIHQKKQPILIGTRSIEDSENLSLALTKKSIEHQVLNALYHEEEAEIITKAGELNMVTIATNMAGRGTDIKVCEEALTVGGLHVIATERHDSERVDKQLFGRTARKGQPGTVQQIVSLEDELLMNNSSTWFRDKVGSKIDNGFWRYILLLNYKRLQKKSDKKASKMRKNILKNDFSIKRMLSFSSKSH
ncbi:MAG: Protein export cytoplasm protein SecA ATPase RNA helicase (TC 3.A.5.1.1) [uncultured Sulfurovum sp.]|uniref:Protein translocase subunit SecA n=1 Tax=uncultured Sulfurovum sp. TaxID=269237 RepID=A0A6S6S0X1_9BACT|nr:MAG: Protein export cytoplasm protein SecA ATPase RNA helicase (TC 3.A.5.1.1) [uncultured Sulfurovum sp.]